MMALQRERTERCPSAERSIHPRMCSRTSSPGRKRRRSAGWDARSKQRSLRWPSSTPITRARHPLPRTAKCAHRWSRRQASPCGISSCIARPAGCGTCATSCAITAYRRKWPRAWARCRRKRCVRASRVANHRTWPRRQGGERTPLQAIISDLLTRVVCHPPPRCQHARNRVWLASRSIQLEVFISKGNAHGRPHWRDHHLPCRHPGALSRQHAADRRPRQTDRARDRDHYRRDFAAEISCSFLGRRCTAPAPDEQRAACSAANSAAVTNGEVTVDDEPLLTNQRRQGHEERRGVVRLLRVGPAATSIIVPPAWR